MIFWKFAGLSLASTVVLTPASAQKFNCIQVVDVLAEKAFRAFPATVDTAARHPVRIRGRSARLFRAVLRKESMGAPNFAGHFQVARIGCGAGSFCPAFVDRQSGEVKFDQQLRVVSWLPSESAPGIDGGVGRLTYHADSRLLVVLGVRNENDRTAGLTMFDWRGGHLHLERFIPHQKLCPARSKR